jgi:phage tail sheath protein FI
MASLLHPGVYVRELSSGVRVIEGAATSTTIFVGETERGPLEPTKIKGVADYERLFGGYLRVNAPNPARVTMRYSIDAFFANGGTSAYVSRAISTSATPAEKVWPTAGPVTHRIRAASPGTWAATNLSAVLAPSSSITPNQARIMVFYRDLRRPSADRVLVEDFDRLSLDVTADNYVGTVLQRSAFIRWDTSLTPTTWPPLATAATRPNDVVHPAEPDAGQLSGGSGGATSASATDVRETLGRLDGVEDASLLVYAADAWAQTQGGAVTIPHAEVFGYIINRPKLDLFYVADLQAQHTATSVTTASSTTASSITTASKSDFMAWYWPHLRVSDPIGQGLNPTIIIPPAGAVAGIFARTDRLRGVWKAPAGVEATLGSIVGIQHDLLDTHQDDLNPLGVNALRTIPAAGPVVWGSRTTIPSGEWRYVPVRRTAIFLRKSIYNGIQWAVFEPNNTDLWRALRATVGAFMETQFRNGAFAGASSKDAYFVKCDAETTPESAQLGGIVNIVVGFAPLRPAEFVVLSLTQMTKLTS